MRVITLNVNGLRSAERKGLARWLARAEPWDIVCVQEIKCLPGDVPKSLAAPRGSHATFHPAERKGYAGVALYSKIAAPTRAGFGHVEFDAEGRYLQADFRDLSIVSLYLPSGSSGAHRQASKFRFLDAFLPHLSSLVQGGREVILCGDWNIAHQPIDLRNWRSNQKNSGFLPEERAWLSQVFDEIGLVDVFRRLDPRPDQYTWWSNRGQAWANNVGWRIDYQIATPGIAATARAASIYKNRRFSDHAPLVVDYDFELS
ncbi:MAG: exodeoxyribonuclease III [Betaproteobacteria bacterium]|nr:exodeoxyribonuclease III [Betaproteobacteria bacterium]MDE2002916.1 exodeoxyribonuclease III [Betaproteobacteria bacterium]